MKKKIEYVEFFKAFFSIKKILNVKKKKLMNASNYINHKLFRK
jgi:hypothetical protein